MIVEGECKLKKIENRNAEVKKNICGRKIREAMSVLQILSNTNFEIALSVIYGIGAVASIWAAILSPHIFDWIGVDVNKRITGRNWPQLFLLSLVMQPLTFTFSAIALWWYPVVAIIPALHFLITSVCFIVIDFVREDEPWEKGYTRLF